MNKKIIFITIVLGLVIIALTGLFFIPNKQNQTPTLLSISPTGLPQHSVGITLRVYGKNLNGKSVIYWNGTAMPTDTQNAPYGFITTEIPGESFNAYGTYPVTVVNGKGKPSNALDFNVARTLDDLLNTSQSTQIKSN